MRSALLFLIAAMAAACTAEAQRQLPAFRRGQWGAQLTIGQSIAAAGVLRFASPRAAWLLDATIRAEHGWHRTAAIPGADFSSASHATTLQARVGRRHYHGIESGGDARRVVSFHTLGAIAGGTLVIMPYRHAPDPKVLELEAGAFADAGASWFPTPRLALGASASASATYGRSRAYAAAGVRQRSVRAELARPVLQLTVLF